MDVYVDAQMVQLWRLLQILWDLDIYQGIYTDVPMVTNGNGKDLLLDLNVSVQGGGVYQLLLLDRGTAFKIGDTITVDDDNVGGSGSGFQHCISNYH